jgi:RHS repeat-associated protein
LRAANSTTQREIDQRFFVIVTDLVGTTKELVDESGAIAWRTRTTLWGTTTWPKTATAHTPLRFPGQYHDLESGLHYNLNRHYDPECARYTTPDPLGLAPALNPVTYVHNPCTWSGPLGLTHYRDGVPQGVSPEDFDAAGRLLREGTGHLGDDIVVQGSRASGTARPDSDIDFAIRVDSSSILRRGGPFDKPPFIRIG